MFAYIWGNFSLLDELAARMTDCSTQTFMSRVLHQQKDKESINDFNRRLDQALYDFNVRLVALISCYAPLIDFHAANLTDQTRSDWIVPVERPSGIARCQSTYLSLYMAV